METFFLCLGTSLLGFALYFVLRDDVLLFRYPIVRTLGTVIGHRISTDDGSTFYMTQFEFLDETGKRNEVTDTYGSGRAVPEIGRKVQLIYPAGFPERAHPPRHILRAIIYLFLLSMLAVLVAKMFGFMPE